MHVLDIGNPDYGVVSNNMSCIGLHIHFTYHCLLHCCVRKCYGLAKIGTHPITLVFDRFRWNVFMTCMLCQTIKRLCLISYSGHIKDNAPPRERLRLECSETNIYSLPPARRAPRWSPVLLCS